MAALAAAPDAAAAPAAARAAAGGGQGAPAAARHRAGGPGLAGGAVGGRRWRFGGAQPGAAADPQRCGEGDGGAAAAGAAGTGAGLRPRRLQPPGPQRLPPHHPPAPALWGPRGPAGGGDLPALPAPGRPAAGRQRGLGLGAAARLPGGERLLQPPGRRRLHLPHLPRPGLV